MADLPQPKRVRDRIADDRWSYRTADGKEMTSRITVGRPYRWPGSRRQDWICLILIEGFTDGVVTIAGVGPVDSLMNALGMVKAFAEQIGQFTPRASDPKSRQEKSRVSTSSRKRLKRS